MSDQIMDNNTYNLLQALASNLEAYTTYQKYAKDGNQQMWQQLAQQTQQAVQMLRQELTRTMGQGQTSQMRQGSQAGSQTSQIGQDWMPVTQPDMSQGSQAGQMGQGLQASQSNAGSQTGQMGINVSRQPEMGRDANAGNIDPELLKPDPDQKMGYANENYSPNEQ